MESKTKDININYETLFEIFRKEKSTEELQKLDPYFFQDVVAYLNEKKKEADNSKTQTRLFDASIETNEKQFQNIKKLVREIYERREKKIISMALNKSRIPSDIIDDSFFFYEEKKMFEELVHLLNGFREGVIDNILNLSPPNLGELNRKGPEAEDFKNVFYASGEEKKKSPFTVVRFVHPVPQFVGSELERYGPFEEDEIAKLPTEIAEILIEKGRAESLE